MTGKFKDIGYMPCNESNGFFPNMPLWNADLIYFCSPNNPTGEAATREQLRALVNFARNSKAVILFDAAYSAYTTNPDLPRTIYEVEGAKEHAIELQSFSKSAGLTGVRLGWTVVPRELKVNGCEQGKVNELWNRRQCTFFNGASIIAQMGGLQRCLFGGRKNAKKE